MRGQGIESFSSRTKMGKSYLRVNLPEKLTPPTKWKKIAKTACSHLIVYVTAVLAPVVEVLAKPLEEAGHIILKLPLTRISLLQY